MSKWGLYDVETHTQGALVMVDRGFNGLRDHLETIGLQAEVLPDGSPELLHFGLKKQSPYNFFSVTGIWERDIGFVKVGGVNVGLIACKEKVMGKASSEFLDYIVDRDPTQSPESFKAFLWEAHREGLHIGVARDWEGGAIASYLLADAQTKSDTLIGLFREAGITPGLSVTPDVTHRCVRVSQSCNKSGWAGIGLDRYQGHPSRQLYDAIVRIAQIVLNLKI